MTIALLIFNLLAIFIAIYSVITLFALIRYGQSKPLAITLAVFYIGIITALYFSGLDIVRDMI